MAVSNFVIYSNAMQAAFIDNTIDLNLDTFRLVLLTDAYTPAQDTHAAFSDLSAAEVAAGGGYSTGGKLLTSTFGRTGNVATFDADDQTWAASSITAKYAAIVRDADGDGTLAAGDVPLAYCNLETNGGSVSSTNGDFTVTMNASGVFALTAAAAA